MEIRSSKSVTMDLYFDELGVILRALDSYVSGDLNDRDEFCHAKAIKLVIECYLHRS